MLGTLLLKKLNFISPDTFQVETEINGVNALMLFQEDIQKELLEKNNRREGPILEGDQKFFFKVVEDIPDNQLSNWSVGMPHLRNKSSKVMLSKLTNANLINRSEVHKEIS